MIVRRAWLWRFRAKHVLRLTRGWNGSREKTRQIPSRGRARTDTAEKNVSQDHRIVACFVVGRKDKRYPAGSCAGAQFVELFRVVLYLIRVSLPKFLPAGWIMPEPFAQIGAGRDAFYPPIDSGVRLSETPGP